MSGPRRLLALLLLVSAIRVEAQEPAPVRLTILQINDVYEITPVEGGRSGGLARVATIRKRLLAGNANTLTVLAGDFLSPSALGTAKVDGERLAGKQMVAVLGAMGLDYATFGNHEFDIQESELLARLCESKFRYVSSNVTDATGKPFPGVVVREIVGVPGGFRVGFLGVTTSDNRKDWVRYGDYVETAREQVAALRGQVDAIVALTHLTVEDDTRLVAEVPEIDLAIGGHEHENRHLWRGSDFTPIVKADANARSVNVIDLVFDPTSRRVDVSVRLVLVTEAVPEDPEVAAEVARWVEKAWAGFRASGFEPDRPVANLAEPLDGLESSVRNRPTDLTRVITKAMLAEVQGAELSILNSGSLRIDDVLPPGPITEYDVIRALPFGGPVVGVEIKGSLLARVLDQGEANAGLGGFLQTGNVTRSPAGDRLVGGAPIDPERWYRAALTDFLLTGLEVKMPYLTRDNPELRAVCDGRDLRRAVIDELARTCPFKE